jgi:hypothetical protein
MESAPSFTPPASVFIPANPVTGVDAFVTPAPKAPVDALAVSTVARGDNTTRRLMMAVLLGAPDAADVATVARLTRSLAGVSAVVCLKDGHILAESNDGSSEAARFVRALPDKIRAVSDLSSFFGEAAATPETIHLQLDRGQITISLQENVTFAVLHDPLRGEPALREKITLLGREVAALLCENAPR